MIHKYINKLIKNLPDNVTKTEKPIEIDLVLDSGCFNGSYLAGALYFLKEMEKRKYIRIDRISGSSIGSFVALIYFIDELDIIPNVYKTVKNNLEKKYNLKTAIKSITEIVNTYVTDDILKKINGKLFICYNDVKKLNKIVKSTYKSKEELIDTIIKSSFIPYLTNGKCVYKNKYVDGLMPYIFEKNKEQCSQKKILFLDLFSCDKFSGALNIKNEKTNYHRILYGLLDIHCFFIKQSSTQMCSYVNEWNYMNMFLYNLRLLLEKIILLLLWIFVKIKNIIPNEFKDALICDILKKICYDIFVIFIKTYCL